MSRRCVKKAPTSESISVEEWRSHIQSTTKSSKKRRGSPESDLQIQCMDWLRARYPVDKYLVFHVPNEGKRKPQYTQKLLKMGMVRGIPDILCIEKGTYEGVDYDGLAIEMKALKGRATSIQMTRLEMLEMRGWLTAVINNYDDFVQLVSEYLG